MGIHMCFTVMHGVVRVRVRACSTVPEGQKAQGLIACACSRVCILGMLTYDHFFGPEGEEFVCCRSDLAVVKRRRFGFAGQRGAHIQLCGEQVAT